MRRPEELLLPPPRSLELTGNICRPARRDDGSPVFCPHDAPELGPEGYRLDITPVGVRIHAGGDAGFFYARATLRQWIELHRPERLDKPANGTWEVPGIVVDDRPDFAVRGVMLDVSRGKVPRLGTLFALVDLLAGFKINQLQLYTEHTFAYRGHQTVWRGASPMTPGEIRHLDAYCRERFIELVPNQQSFGHLHRWLVHEPYRRLAECPEGIEHPFSDVVEPFGLCPTDPGSRRLLADLYGQLLPCFTSRLLNIGGDETLDLGQGRSRQVCAARGREQVYLEFLEALHGLAAERGHRIQFWGDILLERPELLAALPADAIALEWGYEADHPFAEDSPRFAASGREFYVCPGTSSWQSFAGRSRNALFNLADAATHGHAQGATGYLITDWGDHGHLQTLPVSYPGFVAGAAFAWNVKSAADPENLPLAELLDRHVVRDRAGVLGRALLELGDVYLDPGPPPKNGSALFFLLVFALMEKERERIEGVTIAGLECALEHVESAAGTLGDARLGVPDAELLCRELDWTADLLRAAARLGIARFRSGDLGSFDAIPRDERRQLAGELREIVERHRGIVLGRHRPGGLEESATRLLRPATRLAG